MFFRKFPRFSGYSPSSSTIRSALWENAHPSLAAVGAFSNRWRRFPAHFCSFLFSAMVLRGPTSENSDKLHLQAKATQLRCLSQRFALLKWFSSRTHVVSFVTPETRATKDFEPAAAKTFPRGTKYRPTSDREAFNHKTLRLQIQPAISLQDNNKTYCKTLSSTK